MPMYSFICETCGLEKWAFRSKKQAPPRFCGRKCQKQSDHPLIRSSRRNKAPEITPDIHNKIFEVYYNKGTGNGRVKALSQELGISECNVSRYAEAQGWTTRPNKNFDKKNVSESRVFASLHCVNYRKCRDEAAFANESMQCHKCDRQVFEDDHYLKEVGAESINNYHTGEHSVRITVGASEVRVYK